MKPLIRKTFSLLLTVLLSAAVFCSCAAPAEPPAADTAAAPANNTAAPEDDLLNSSTVPEGYSEIALAFPNGNYYAPAAEQKPLAAELLLPEGWSVKRGGFTGNGYYPDETFVSLCIPASTGGKTFYSVYNEAGDCVGTVSCVGFVWLEEYGDRGAMDPTEAELLAMRVAYSEQMMGSMRCLSLDFTRDKLTVTVGGMLALIGTAEYDTKTEENPQQLSLPAIVSFDDEYDFGIFMEFADGALTEEQLHTAAESIRIGFAEG